MTLVGIAFALLVAGAPGEVPRVVLDGLEPEVAQQLQGVRERLDRALAKGGPAAAVYGEAGRHYQAYGLAAAGEACYRRAEQLDPADYRWPYLLGLLLFDDSRLDDAAAAFERALRRPEKYYPALVRLAGIYLTQGRLADAAATLGPAQRHAPDDAALLAAQGQLALAQGRPEEALRAFTRALERQPRATRLHYSLGMAYRALGRLDEARQQLALAGSVGVRPQDPLLDEVQALRLGERSHLLEGHTAFRARDYQSAAAAYRRALEASGATSVGALVNLAAAESQLGQAAAAVEHLRQAQRLEPGDTAVLYNLGALLLHAGRAGEAEAVLRDLLARAPGDDPARVAWALALLALERPTAALEALEQAGRIESERCAEVRARVASLEAGSDPVLAARARALEQRVLRGACPPAGR